MNGARGRRGGAGRDTLSRDERSALYGEAGFTPLQHVLRCPDCRDNELSPPTAPDQEAVTMGPKRTFGCETCDGTGTIPAYGRARLDPYMTAKAIHG